MTSPADKLVAAVRIFTTKTPSLRALQDALHEYDQAAPSDVEREYREAAVALAECYFVEGVTNRFYTMVDRYQVARAARDGGNGR